MAAPGMHPMRIHRKRGRLLFLFSGSAAEQLASFPTALRELIPMADGES